MTFKDKFSQQAAIYAKYRPHYPTGLYTYLHSLVDEHELAWDCGTGNGQAAVGLTKFFNKVIATDPSEEQIKNCIAHDRIKYVVEKAEHSSIETNSVDLLTIATALHWFDFETFYKEANRVLKPNAVIAAWAYGVPTILSPEVDELIQHFHYHTLDSYWLHENRLVEKGYETIPFPFQQIHSPEFYFEKTMKLDELAGYLNTWSATQSFINENKFNPTEQVFAELRNIWGDVASEKTVRWKLAMKVGRKVI
jgi:SAM-dependent methyltransferase